MLHRAHARRSDLANVVLTLKKLGIDDLVRAGLRGRCVVSWVPTIWLSVWNGAPILVFCVSHFVHDSCVCELGLVYIH